MHINILAILKNIKNEILLSLISFSKYKLPYLFYILAGLLFLFIIFKATDTIRNAKPNLLVVTYL